MANNIGQFNFVSAAGSNQNQAVSDRRGTKRLRGSDHQEGQSMNRPDVYPQNIYSVDKRLKITHRSSSPNGAGASPQAKDKQEKVKSVFQELSNVIAPPLQRKITDNIEEESTQVSLSSSSSVPMTDED